MSAELIEKTREHVAALEAELEKWRTVLTLLGEEKGPATRKKAKPRKEGKAAKPARPTSAGKTGQENRQRIAAYLEKHPEAGNAEIAKALGLPLGTVGGPAAALRKRA